MQYVFFAAVIGLLGGFLFSLVMVIRRQPLSPLGRGLLVVLRLMPTPVLLFGFWASGEPGTHWGWRFGYGALFIGCIVTAIQLCWPKRTPSTASQEVEE